MASCKGVTLVIFNAIFALLGIGLLAVGCLVKFGDGLSNKYLNDAFLKIVVEGAEMSLSKLIDLVAIIAICIGAFIFVIAVIGILGVCCSSKCLLATYAVITLIILIAQVASVVFSFIFYDKLIKDELKGFMNETLQDTYTNNNEDPVTRGWNYMFAKFECCGVDNYKDITTALDSKNTNLLPAGFNTPAHCCKNINMDDFPNIKPPPNDQGLDCAKNMTVSNSNYMNGCYDAMEDLLRHKVLALAIGGAVILVVQLLMIILAFCLCREVGDADGKMV